MISEKAKQHNRKAGKFFPAFFSKAAAVLLLVFTLCLTAVPYVAAEELPADSEAGEMTAPAPENQEVPAPAVTEEPSPEPQAAPEPAPAPAENPPAEEAPAAPAPQPGEETEESSEAETQPTLPDAEQFIKDVPRPENAWPTLDQIGGAAYIVADGDSGEILLEMNGDAIAYPASMTKILTALTVIEHPDFDPLKPIYFSQRACAMPAPESSTAGFIPGEIAPTISCLYAMMLRSANEVANALAENYGGSIEGFMELANAKAKELGCENTNFTDPCGFGYVDHHTTGRDMVKIIQRAMKHRIFQEVVKAKYYSLPPTNMHTMSGWSNMHNGNYLVLFSDAGYQSPYLKSIDGVKPGNTDLAGDCLASAATTYDGRHLIAVMFNAAYLGPYPNSFVGPAIMSRTLLEEGAKRIGAPYTPDPKEKDVMIYGWPTYPDPTAERIAETTPVPSEIPSFTMETFNANRGEEDEHGVLRVQRWQMALMIVVMTLCLLIAMLSVYFGFMKRRPYNPYQPLK